MSGDQREMDDDNPFHDLLSARRQWLREHWPRPRRPGRARPGSAAPTAVSYGEGVAEIDIFKLAHARVHPEIP